MDAVVEGILKGDWLSTRNTVADIIVGPKCGRHGGQKDAGTVAALVDYYMRMGGPIPLVTMWGVHKGQRGWSQGIDWLDVMAIERYKLVNDAVKAWGYAPGIRVTVVMEDYTRYLMEGNTPPSMVYSAGLMGLARGSCVRIWHESREIVDTDFQATVRGNMRELNEAYHTADYSRLERRGWRGVPNWNYYISRVQNQMPELDAYDAFQRVMKYFAIALARYQYGIVPEGIKVSYYPYPDGTNLMLHRRRIEWKAKPSKGSHRTDAPWCSWWVAGEGVIGWCERRSCQFDVCTEYYGSIPVNTLVRK